MKVMCRNISLKKMVDEVVQTRADYTRSKSSYSIKCATLRRYIKTLRGDDLTRAIEHLKNTKVNCDDIIDDKTLL